MNKIIQVGNIRDNVNNFCNPQTGRIYSADGIAPTITATDYKDSLKNN